SSGGATVGATTESFGIDGGADDDTLRNAGSTITATSAATLTLDSSSFTFGGAGGTQGAMVADTRAIGMSGRAGRDYIENAGAIGVPNTATFTSTSHSDVAFGSSGASATTGAVAVTHGMDGGDDDDVLRNAGSISLTTAA